ncbi:MAG: Gfo/Idh/MocA family oxidoreductase [Verrucomicrobiota bacterium]|jgi:predicted dehydrogenase|nr:Gfo/Idh/MocA family oxidoreductase [Verrucomicrobiota bacterium]
MQRRQFIQASAGAALAAPFIVRGAKPKIKIGQIGSGHSHASGKLAAIRKLSDDFELVGVAQPREAAEVPIPSGGAYRGVKQMTEEQLLNISGLKAVAIETEVPYLVGAAKRAVGAGLHIHHDKPGGTTLKDFRELLELAKRKGITVQMGYMLRYNPAFQFMYRAVNEGWLGNIMEVDAMMGKMASSSLRRELGRYDGGGMFELACHLVDSVVHLLGKPDRVQSFTRRTQEDGVADNQLAVLEYAKATATVRCNHRDVYGFSRRRFQIAGDRGVIEIRPLEPGNQLELSLASARGGHKRGTQIVNLSNKRGGRYDGEFTDLAKVIRGETKLAWSYEHDLAVQETVLRAAGMPVT